MAPRRALIAPAELTPQLAEFLHRLAEAEQTATGPDRRPAFRLTRIVIAAALDNHVPLHQLSECLGTSVGAVRGRVTHGDAEIAPKTVTKLTGLTPEQIEVHGGSALTVTPSGNYLATDIVRLLLTS